MKYKLKDIKKDRLVIFDLDDTLVKTDAKVKIVGFKSGKILKELTPEEFNNFVKTEKHVLNFDDFEDPEILMKGEIIQHIFSKLRYYYKKGVPVCILTARSSSDLVRRFFLENGIDIHESLVIAIHDPMYSFKGDSIAERKADAIKDLINGGYTDLVFFDDNDDNLSLAKSMEGYKNCKIKIVKV